MSAVSYISLIGIFAFMPIGNGLVCWLLYSHLNLLSYPRGGGEKAIDPRRINRSTGDLTDQKKP